MLVILGSGVVGLNTPIYYCKVKSFYYLVHLKSCLTGKSPVYINVPFYFLQVNNVNI